MIRSLGRGGEEKEDDLNGQFHFRSDSLALDITGRRTGQSEILHLSGQTIADVSRGRSFEEQEKCPLGTEMWEAVEEEMGGEEGRREEGSRILEEGR